MGSHVCDHDGRHASHDAPVPRVTPACPVSHARPAVAEGTSAAPAGRRCGRLSSRGHRAGRSRAGRRGGETLTDHGRPLLAMTSSFICHRRTTCSGNTQDTWFISTLTFI